MPQKSNLLAKLKFYEHCGFLSAYSTKIRMFNCLVKPVLLYGSETWRMNTTPINKVQTFVNSCLRKIIRIHWPDRIANEELWLRTRQRPMMKDMKLRKWKWIGHTLRKPKESITRQALTWNPPGEEEKWKTKKHLEVGC